MEIVNIVQHGPIKVFIYYAFMLNKIVQLIAGKVELSPLLGITVSPLLSNALLEKTENTFS